MVRKMDPKLEIALLRAANLFYEYHKAVTLPWEDVIYSVRFQEKSGDWFRAEITIKVSPVSSEKET